METGMAAMAIFDVCVSGCHRKKLPSWKTISILVKHGETLISKFLKSKSSIVHNTLIYFKKKAFMLLESPPQMVYLSFFCWFDIWQPTQLGLKRWNSGGTASPGLPLPTGSSSARGVVLPAAVNQRKDQQKRHNIGTLIGTLMGKPSINGPCSMAMLNNQMVLSQWHRCHCFSLIVYSCYSCVCRLKNTCIETVVHCVCDLNHFSLIYLWFYSRM